jgi:uncharacterized protein
MKLRPVAEIAEAANGVVARFEADAGPLLGGAEVHHIGATALGAGRTKGDVDVNVRVEPAAFEAVVERLRERFAVAQLANWTPTFASFETAEYGLPLGIQVTAIGSDDDFLLAVRDRFQGDARLLERYDAVKAEAAAHGPEAYWQAKDAFLRGLLGERRR